MTASDRVPDMRDHLRTEALILGDRTLRDSTVTCVITRFGVRNPLDLLALRKSYRETLVAARRASNPELLRSAFLVENARACFTISIWSHPRAIPRFGTLVPEHVTAARDAFQRLSYQAGRGPELWSTKWQLRSTSNNLNWDDFDLRSTLGGEFEG